VERITLPKISPLALEFDAENQREFGPCPHCGQMTKRVWGYAYQSEQAIAAYFVEWTPLHEPLDAIFDLIVGQWGDETDASNRRAVSVAFRMLESGPSFMVQNAKERKVASSELISNALSRQEVLGTPLADTVFGIIDLIYLADPRLTELRR
jgi:hypothetical protein